MSSSGFNQKPLDQVLSLNQIGLMNHQEGEEETMSPYLLHIVDSGTGDKGSIAMSCLPQFGLLPLPRELRDKIYHDLVGGTHLVFWPETIFDPYGRPTKEIRQRQRPRECWNVFHISKATRNEAMEMAHSHGIFRYWIDTASMNHSPSPPEPTLRFTKSIEIDFERSEINIFEPAHRSSTILACSKVLSSLGGSEVVRDLVRVRLPRNSFDLVIRRPHGHMIFSPLGEMTGVKILIVEISYDETSRNIENGSKAEREAGTRGTTHSRHLSMHGDDIKRSIRNCLQPKIGDCTELDMTTVGNMPYARCLEFHPREHRMKSIENAVGTLMHELDQLKKAV